MLYHHNKCQVFLYGLRQTASVLISNLVKITDESRDYYGKARRRDSHLKDAFAAGMTELDMSPEIADQLMVLVTPDPQPTSQPSQQVRAPVMDEQVEVLPFELLLKKNTVPRVPQGSSLVSV